jgi:hypothetical protein
MLPRGLTIQLTTPAGAVAWAARVFLVLGADGLIQEDYQLTVKPLAPSPNSRR